MNKFLRGGLYFLGAAFTYSAMGFFAAAATTVPVLIIPAAICGIVSIFETYKGCKSIYEGFKEHHQKSKAKKAVHYNQYNNSYGYDMQKQIPHQGYGMERTALGNRMRERQMEESQDQYKERKPLSEKLLSKLTGSKHREI